MSHLRSSALHLVAFMLLPLLFGAWGVHEYETRERPDQLARAAPELLAKAARPTLDPTRPTVVVVLGADITEITDALGPFEMFARVGGLNVVTAAPERRPTLLTGGLAVLPHYSLAEIDAQLGNDGTSIVVVPNIPNIAAPVNAPIVAWLQNQASAGAMMHSWCKGAMALAHAGLLDGKEATAHWGDLPKLTQAYPQVRWVRGVRWVEHGSFVVSAGITSGIDASLRVIQRRFGDDSARRVARELRYPNYHFAIDPRAEQYTLEPADAVLLANAAFGRLNTERIGLALYPGVGELDVSNIYDAHAYTMTAAVDAVSLDAEVIQTAHGLTLLPSIVVSSKDFDSLAQLDELVVPGPDARKQAASLTRAIASLVPSMRVAYLHADEPRRFGLEPVLEELSRSSDVATATFAMRRMEYRSQDVAFAGSSWPWHTVLLPLLLGALGIGILQVTLRVRARGSVRS